MLTLKTPEDSTEHTNSYYAATANKQAIYPQLQGDQQTDIIIVGGGFSGINTAIELAERGYQVSLVEARRIGWGASGRNGGQIIGGYTAEDLSIFRKYVGEQGVKALYNMGVESVDILKQRVEQHNIDCDLTWGYCDVAIKKRHMEEFESYADEQQKLGYPHQLELLTSDELKHQVNSNNYIGGLLNKDGAGHCHPLNLCLGEAEVAAKLGVKIYEQSKVLKVIQGSQPKIITEHGTIQGNHLVLCCNAYIERLVPKIASKILASNSSVIATAPLTDEQIQAIMPGNNAVSDPRFVLDYFRLSADKRMLFGGLSNYTGLEPTNLEQVMRSKMLKVFPSLNDVAIDYGWSGQIGIGFNRLPQLGRLDGNVYYMQAYSGHGVAPTHLMARITAQMIAGQAESFDIFAAVKHQPFIGSIQLRGPIFAIGMLYYRLLDAF